MSEWFFRCAWKFYLRQIEVRNILFVHVNGITLFFFFIEYCSRKNEVFKLRLVFLYFIFHWCCDIELFFLFFLLKVLRSAIEWCQNDLLILLFMRCDNKFLMRYPYWQHNEYELQICRLKNSLMINMYFFLSFCKKIIHTMV
jgi:hypothetical protein